MLEITVSGRLSADPLEGSRTHVDGGHITVVCTWLWCDMRDAGAWIYLVAARPTACTVLSGLRKDDRVLIIAFASNPGPRQSKHRRARLMTTQGRTIFSFVMDHDPRFAYEAWHLARSLIEHCGGDPSSIHVQCLPEVNARRRSLFGEFGCHVHEIARFGDGRYCNSSINSKTCGNSASPLPRHSTDRRADESCGLSMRRLTLLFQGDCRRRPVGTVAVDLIVAKGVEQISAFLSQLLSPKLPS
jgi:hypothetical protein